MSEVGTTLVGLIGHTGVKWFSLLLNLPRSLHLRYRMSSPDHQTKRVVLVGKLGKNLGMRIALVTMNPMIIFKRWKLSRQVSLSRSLYRDMPTIISLLETYKLAAPLHSIMDCYFFLLEIEHLP